MRRSLLLAAGFLTAAMIFPSLADAQGRPGGGRGGSGGGGGDQEDPSKKKKKEAEWGDSQAPLQQLRNAGPCPFVKVLYDAGRYMEFKGGKVSSNSVGYTGEIQSISAGCAYKDDQPIRVTMDVLFEMGRGPGADGAAKTYRYWVAVTQRNKTMIDKHYFDLPVKFAPGQDRLYVTDSIGEVMIPRASVTTSGANFEVLVGFDVTPEMADFNRQGKRFLLTSAGAAAGGAAVQK